MVPYLDLDDHTAFYSSPGTVCLITYQDVRPSADAHTCIQFSYQMTLTQQNQVLLPCSPSSQLKLGMERMVVGLLFLHLRSVDIPIPCVAGHPSCECCVPLLLLRILCPFSIQTASFSEFLDHIRMLIQPVNQLLINTSLHCFHHSHSGKQPFGGNPELSRNLLKKLI